MKSLNRKLKFKFGIRQIVIQLTVIILAVVVILLIFSEHLHTQDLEKSENYIHENYKFDNEIKTQTKSVTNALTNEKINELRYHLSHSESLYQIEEVFNNILLPEISKIEIINSFWADLINLSDKQIYFWLVTVINDGHFDDLSKPSDEFVEFCRKRIECFIDAFPKNSKKLFDTSILYDPLQIDIFELVTTAIYYINTNKHKDILVKLKKVFDNFMKYDYCGYKIDLFLLDYLASEGQTVSKTDFIKVKNAYNNSNIYDKRILKIEKELGLYVYPIDFDINVIKNSKGNDIIKQFDDIKSFLTDKNNSQLFWETIFKLDYSDLGTWLYCVTDPSYKIVIPINDFVIDKTAGIFKDLCENFKILSTKQNLIDNDLFVKSKYLYIQLLEFIEIYKGKMISESIRYIKCVLEVCEKYNFWGYDIDIETAVFLAAHGELSDKQIYTKLKDLYDDNWRYYSHFKFLKEKLFK